LFVSITGFYNAEWLHDLLYTSEDTDAAMIMRWCLPALIGYSLVQVYGTVMTATNQLIAFSVIILSSLILNIVLNFILIPRLGALGCCYAAIASQLSCGMAAMIFVKQKTNVAIRFKTILIYVFIAALIGAVYYSGAYLGINTMMMVITTSVIVMGTIGFMALSNLSRIKEKSDDLE
jgi:O-antigen/teichoic acid export membrane protein